MIDDAIRDLRSGKPVLIFDSAKREGETDIVIASQHITSEKIRFMRKNGGGLICTTLRESEARVLGLPFIEDFYRDNLKIEKRAMDTSDMKYDKNSSFSVTINHRKTFTGISDNDRSLTASAFAELLGEIASGKTDGAVGRFVENFRIPGHISLIIAREGYFRRRRGHTELGTYLSEAAGLIPSVTLVEMLDDNGLSLNREKAMRFASENSLTFIDGESIIQRWNNDQSDGHRSVRHTSSGTSALLEGIQEVGR
ncbi:MAG: 3,4-dihydroxy-2-butanone-4-phosphate synthase [Thermoplasmataceae archaeon]|jgi:3,4-dihydroxy 2-butanone 4-phosphate synthase